MQPIIIRDVFKYDTLINILSEVCKVNGHKIGKNAFIEQYKDINNMFKHRKCRGVQY